MQIYNGKSVFGGIAIGKISVYQKKEQQVKRVKIDDPEQEMARTEAVINSMTMKERRNPDLINGSRRQRIAAGSGTQVVDINRLLKQFEMMQAMTKQFVGGKMPKSMRRLMGKKGGKMPGLPF